jgi:hypothetical protein
MIRRGDYPGEPVGDEPMDEADHYVKCPLCGGYFDARDLAQVLEHAGPLPHPEQDQKQ